MVDGRTPARQIDDPDSDNDLSKPEESDEEEFADEINEIQVENFVRFVLFGCAMRALVVLFVDASCVLASERITCFLLHRLANDAGDDDDNDHDDDDEDVDDVGAVAEDAVSDVDAVNKKKCFENLVLCASARKRLCRLLTKSNPA